jgi:hypothetical protein
MSLNIFKKPEVIAGLAVVAVLGIIIGKKYVADTSSTQATTGHVIPFLSGI